eukprot:666400-Hanusia_phi.AAC.1
MKGIHPTGSPPRRSPIMLMGTESESREPGELTTTPGPGRPGVGRAWSEVVGSASVNVCAGGSGKRRDESTR